MAVPMLNIPTLPNILPKSQSARSDRPDSIDEDKIEQKLRHAALHGDIAALKDALFEGAAVDAVDEKLGHTALMLAAARGRIAVIQELLHVGADMDLVASDGGTCLHVAARWGQSHAVEEFLRRGSDATFQDKKGRTAADVCRSIINADPCRNPAGVHPTQLSPKYFTAPVSPHMMSSPSRKSSPLRRLTYTGSEDSGTPRNSILVLHGVDEDAANEAAAALRRARQDAFALANQRLQLELSGHERCLQMLEDWERGAAEAMAAQEASDEEAEFAATSTVDDHTLDEMLARIRELTFTVEGKTAEIEVLDEKEAALMKLVTLESAEIRRAEQTLREHSVELSKNESSILGAVNKRKLANYDLAKLTLSLQEQQVELARLEGRIELKAELEAPLPDLKKARKKAAQQCRELLRSKRRSAALDALRGNSSPSLRASVTFPDEAPLDPSSPHPFSLLSRPFFASMSMSETSRRRSSFTEGSGYDEDEEVPEPPAFELPDHFGGLVPQRLALKDDAWRVLDDLRAQIDALRGQVRELGEKPHC